MDFLFAKNLIVELIAFSLCRMKFSGAASTPFLVPICDEYIQFSFVKSKVSCNFFRMQCPPLDQSVWSDVVELFISGALD